MSGTEESRKAQDYTFEALHRVYFYDAWRPEPILDVPGSELVLPPESGLLVQGCYWPQPRAVDDILSVSDADTEDAENPGQSPAAPTTTDATMEAGEANSLVSVPSSPTGPSTLPSSSFQAGPDSPMGEGDDDATSPGEESDCLSNCPSSSHIRQENDAMTDEGGEESSALPPQGVDPSTDGSPSNLSESPIRRRPAAKQGSWRSQFKKLRQSAGQARQQPLGSIPENVQQPVTMEDLANRTASEQGTPVSVNPATASDHPEHEPAQQNVTAEINLDNGQGDNEQGGLQPQT